MRTIPLLLAGFVAVGCSGVGNPPPHIVVPQTTVVPESVNSVAAPSQIIIDKIGVNTALKPFGLKRDRTLDVPDLDHVDQAAWLCDGYNGDATRPACRVGVVPGAVGPGIVNGHIDGRGKPGVFFRLKEMAVGDTIQIRRVDGVNLTFRVSKVQYMSKSQFDTKAVYRNQDHAALRVISCGGPFVGGETGYRDNIVVFADLVT